MESAIAALGKLVASTKDVQLPGPGRFSALALNAETEAYHLQLYRKNKQGCSMSIRRSLETGIKAMDDVSDVPCSEKVVDYIDSRWELTRLRRTIDDAFTDFDLVALPTMRLLPPTINDALAGKNIQSRASRRSITTAAHSTSSEFRRSRSRAASLKQGCQSD